ncbi:hypothetical protein [Micromonospora foliorum]|uniref:hypothetical protein n=1 Tax=Micromonospora foliorum TaxID=2911210 RepID=UPI001EE8B36E|nr:hypothetical protein [Micromonospora foliorum]MCG5436438.1 hypothetical protein [Micromonospora foliorum]
MIAAGPEGQTDAVRGRAQRGGRLLFAASALLFGVFGWLTAHAATIWLLGHTGPGSGETHHHPHLSGAVLLTGCLAGGSLLAVLAVAVRGGPQLDAHLQRSRRAAAHRSSLLSTAAFVAAEFVEHALTGQHDMPPLGVLLLGCVVHAAMGAGTSLLWRCWVDDLLQLAALLRGHAPTYATRRARWHARRQIAARRTWQALASAGRAPPQRPIHALGNAHI